MDDSSDILSALVLSLKLETIFQKDCVTHTRRTASESQPYLSQDTRNEAEEIWDIDRVIGRGGSSVVRFERRRFGAASVRDTGHSSRFRAVKIMSKFDVNGEKRDYMTELKIAAKFSEPDYAPYFATIKAWFENEESIFVAMDNFPLGDLGRIMYSSLELAIPEAEAIEIIQQITSGIRFMHESGFAHRDLKPNNILVVNRNPCWVVQITDFGISKQTVDGMASYHSRVIGTLGYAAPEVIGAFSNTRHSNYYTFAIDIWAIGVIAIEMILKRRLFEYLDDLFEYIRGEKRIDFRGAARANPSDSFKDFVTRALVLDPMNRPTADALLAHEWMSKNDASTQKTFSPFATSFHVQGEYTRATSPSINMSNMALMSPLSSSIPSTQSTTRLLPTYQGEGLSTDFLLPCFQSLEMEQAKFFILRAVNAVDVETSAAHNIWVSSQRVNKILDKAYRATGGKVVLFLSVIKSQQLCGVTQMTSSIDWENTDDHWSGFGWQGRFTMNWLNFTLLPFSRVKNVPVKPNTAGFRVVACHDGTEIHASSAFELLKAISIEEREKMMGALLIDAINQL